MKTDSQIIDELIRREGDKFTDHPADKGGPTKYGITLDTLQRYRRRQRPGVMIAITRADVEALTEVEARQIYRDDFVVLPGFYRIHDDTLRGFLVDAGVQHGPDRVVLWLQKSVKVTVDGDLGPKTADAANATHLRTLFAELVAVRCEFYGEIVTRDRDLQTARAAGIRLQAENALGWARRLAEFIRETAVL